MLSELLASIGTWRGNCASRVPAVPLNVAEGCGLRGGRRRQSYEYALGEARETLANLEVAEAIGYVPSIEERVPQRLDHLIGTLVHSRALKADHVGGFLRRERTPGAGQEMCLSSLWAPRRVFAERSSMRLLLAGAR